MNPSARLLPPPPDLCQICARGHDFGAPCDPSSPYWHAKRRLEGLAPPTWELALAHCQREIADSWIEVLQEEGIELDLCEIATLRDERDS